MNYFIEKVEKEYLFNRGVCATITEADPSSSLFAMAAHFRGSMQYNTDCENDEGRSWQYAGEWAHEVEDFGSGDEGGHCPLFLYRLHERVQTVDGKTGFVRDYASAEKYGNAPPPDSRDVTVELDDVYDTSSVR